MYSISRVQLIAEYHCFFCFLILNDALILCVPNYIDFMAMLLAFTCKLCICIYISNNSPGKLSTLVNMIWTQINKPSVNWPAAEVSPTRCLPPCILLNHNLKKDTCWAICIRLKYFVAGCFQGVVAVCFS